MKYYNRDTDAAIVGMNGLTLEQVGFYNLVIDLLYSRDGIVPADPHEVSRMMRRDPRLVRRLMIELMTAEKIRITSDGLLCANGVDKTLLRAKIRSTSVRSLAEVREKNHKIAKENNVVSIPLKRKEKKRSKKLAGEERGKVEQLKDEPFGERH